MRRRIKVRSPKSGVKKTKPRSGELQQAELVRQEDEEEGEDEEGRRPGVFAHRALAVFAH